MTLTNKRFGPIILTAVRIEIENYVDNFPKLVKEMIEETNNQCVSSSDPSFLELAEPLNTLKKELNLNLTSNLLSFRKKIFKIRDTIINILMKDKKLINIELKTISIMLQKNNRVDFLSNIPIIIEIKNNLASRTESAERALANVKNSLYLLIEDGDFNAFERSIADKNDVTKEKNKIIREFSENLIKKNYYLKALAISTYANLRVHKKDLFANWKDNNEEKMVRVKNKMLNTFFNEYDFEHPEYKRIENILACNPDIKMNISILTKLYKYYQEKGRLDLYLIIILQRQELSLLKVQEPNLSPANAPSLTFFEKIKIKSIFFKSCIEPIMLDKKNRQQKIDLLFRILPYCELDYFNKLTSFLVENNLIVQAMPYVEKYFENLADTLKDDTLESYSLKIYNLSHLLNKYHYTNELTKLYDKTKHLFPIFKKFKEDDTIKSYHPMNSYLIKKNSEDLLRIVRDLSKNLKENDLAAKEKFSSYIAEILKALIDQDQLKWFFEFVKLLNDSHQQLSILIEPCIYLIKKNNRFFEEILDYTININNINGKKDLIDYTITIFNTLLEQNFDELTIKKINLLTSDELKIELFDKMIENLISPQTITQAMMLIDELTLACLPGNNTLLAKICDNLKFNGYLKEAKNLEETIATIDSQVISQSNSNIAMVQDASDESMVTDENIEENLIAFLNNLPF